MVLADLAANKIPQFLKSITEEQVGEERGSLNSLGRASNTKMVLSVSKTCCACLTFCSMPSSRHPPLPAPGAGQGGQLLQHGLPGEGGKEQAMGTIKIIGVDFVVFTESI